MPPSPSINPFNLANPRPPRPVKTYETLSPRSQRRLRQQYNIVSSRYPDSSYTFQDYLGERQAGEVTPTARTPARRLPESVKRKIGNYGTPFATDYDPQVAAQAVYEKIVDSLQSQYAGQYGDQTYHLPDGTIITASQGTGFAVEVNYQTILWNMTHASSTDRIWAVERASGSQIRHRATQANKRGESSPWFYHQDLFQGV